MLEVTPKIKVRFGGNQGSCRKSFFLKTLLASGMV
jgi:hypothetical protein